MPHSGAHREAWYQVKNNQTQAGICKEATGNYTVDEFRYQQCELAPAPTELQVRMLDILAQSPNSSCTTTILAKRLGTSSLAIASAGRALERYGVLTSWRIADDTPKSLVWAIKLKPDSGPGAAENPAADH